MCKSRKFCNAYVVMLHTILGMTHTDICEETGWPSNTVGNILGRRCNVLDGKHRKPRRYRKTYAKDVNLDQIEREYLAGATTYELGEKYGVRHETIGKWMRNRGIHRGKGNSTGRVVTCQRCGKRFTAHRSNQKYCSMTCQRAVTGMRHDDLLRCANHGYAIPLFEVYKRDKGRCYICGKKTDWKDFRMVNGCKVIGNLYPTREHVIALHNGGTHTWDNVRLACHRCNSAKSDKGQTRLVI